MKATAREWFRIQNVADDPSTVDIHIIDIIGSWDDDFLNRYFGEQLFGITARAFVEALAALPETVQNIRLHINSPGGDVWGAVNIANALRDQQLSKGRTVATIIDGLAASAASIIAMAGSSVQIADNALVMVHNPYTVAVGTAADMRKVADALDSVRGQIIATYQWHSGLSTDALASLMDAETWMDADQALEHGFATEKAVGLLAAAAIDPHALGALKVPERFRARVQAFTKKVAPAPPPASAADVLAAVDAAGLSAGFARELVAAALPMDQVSAKIAAAAAAKAATETRAAEIRALCTTAHLPQLADGYIHGAMPVADVQAHLTTITAAMDKAEVDTGLHPDAAAAKAKPQLNPAAIYAERNKPKKE